MEKNIDKDVAKLYGNQVRVRVSGLCIKDNCILMVNHAGLGRENFWAPPGGGIEFTQNASETLVREYAEETGISVKTGKFIFACEYIKEPLHSIELFFEAVYESGFIKTGADPEMAANKQIIRDVKWMTFEQVKSLPKEDVHGIFNIYPEPEDIMKLSGYWPI